MITTKQRAYLRALANEKEPMTQIGKGGLNENGIKAISAALEAHELVKLTVLETCPEPAKDIMPRLCEALGCEPVQVIGRRVVIYRRASKPENRKIILPR